MITNDLIPAPTLADLRTRQGVSTTTVFLVCNVTQGDGGGTAVLFKVEGV